MKKVVIPGNICHEIDEWAKRYPSEQKQSAVIQALTLVQEDNGGHLTNGHIEAVAEYLHMPSILVYEVATFYTMFHLKPVGRHVISVCTNISCMLCGSSELVAHLKQKLGIGVNETTEDGQFTLQEVECLAACAGAPACLVDKKYHENMSPQKVDGLLDKLKG